MPPPDQRVSRGTTTQRAGVVDGTSVRAPTPRPGPSGAAAPATTRPARACPCTGRETATITGLGAIASYTGDFPSPLQVMWYTPRGDEPLRTTVPDSEIRGWIKQAAEYQRIPHVLLATILQQENAPSASGFRQFLQFGERSATTFAAILDRALWDIVPDRISGGSSGFANMSRNALNDAVSYTQRMYCRPPLPDSVRYRILGWDQDTRISGDDWRSDLYYCAAHLRHLIDRVTGRPCFDGALTLAQLQAVIAAYNGSGPLAKKYGEDAMSLLSRAQAGTSHLYFYER